MAKNLQNSHFFYLFFVIKDPLKNLEAQNQNSTSLSFWAILLCTFTPYNRKIGWKLREPIWFETRQIWGIWKLRPAYSLETPNLGQIRRFLEPCDLEIWRMTLKNNRAPLLCYFKLYASFRSHRWIQDGVTVRKRPIWVKIDNFFSRVTLQFDVWPWETIGHLFYATSSFVHHFVAIGDFKLELQSGNAQFGSNSTIFRAAWPWNLTDDLEKQ